MKSATLVASLAASFRHHNEAISCPLKPRAQPTSNSKIPIGLEQGETQEIQPYLPFYCLIQQVSVRSPMLALTAPWWFLVTDISWLLETAA